ncbi:hypothetical protein [Paracoccus sp. (in: a-proteobacteria)]|uniref:hypothetical protein n=1 Tax=Paracoccus sp. TaxID=267 RepID=UPI00396C48D2
MGNSLALMMLAIWPIVSAFLFSKLDYQRAALWTVLAGYLLLPPVSAIHLPMIPSLTKDSIVGICAIVGALSLRKDAVLPWIRLETWVIVLVGVAVVTPMVTMVTNPEPLVEGISYRPGLGIKDGISGVMYVALELMPFIVGYMVLSSRDAIRVWMLALLLAGLAYTLPMLIEIRLSPQLNVWIYGFFAHDFGQSMRYGGFRPMVFLEHGLWVAMFTVMVVLSAAVMLREPSDPARSRKIATLVYLLAVLVLCKSVASMLYAFTLVPVILFLGPRWQAKLAGVLAIAVFVYPVALWLGLVPVKGITDLAMGLDAERGQSLEFRFDNEQVLLDRASLKPLAGWGAWGRNLEVDPYSGRFTTVTDGQWIVAMTLSGILGYVASFGLLCGSVVRIWLSARSNGIDRWTAGLALIMAANLVDLIPNATLTPLTWLSAGALAGLAARGVASQGAAERPAAVLLARRPAMRTIIG